MADFQSQAMGLTGLTIDASSTAPSRAEFSTFLNDGVIDVTNRVIRLRPQDMEDFLRESAETTSNASLDINGAKILSVVREDGVTSDNWRPCRKVSPSQQYLVTDVNSLHFSSKFYPSYMVGDNGLVSVFPAPGADPNAFKVYYVNNAPVETDGTALDHASTGIKYFPNDKVYLVILYSGIKSLQSALSAVDISTFSLSSVPPDVPSLTAVSFSETNALSISASVPGTPSDPSISSPGVATVAKADISGDVPTYSKPTITTKVSFDTFYEDTSSSNPFGDNDPGALSIVAVAPAVPTISSQVISDPSSFAPAYTKPVLSLSAAPTISDLSITTAVPVAPAISSQAIVDPSSFAPAYTKPVLSLATVPTISDLTISAISPVSPSGPSFTAPDISGIFNPASSPPSYVAPVISLGSAPTISDLSISSVPPDVPTLSSITFSSIDSAVDSTLTVVAAGGTLGSASVPTYSPPGHPAQVAFASYWTVGDFGDSDPGSLSITAVPPATPSLPSITSPGVSSVTLSNVGVPPTYTAPVVGGATEEITNTMTATTGDGYGTDADFLDFSMWFTTVGELIEDEEDTELAQVQLQKISAYIQAYSGAMQNQLNVFNDANAEYQGKLQEAIQQAQINAQEAQKEGDLTFQASIQDYTLELQKYQADVGKYQAEVAQQVQEYTQKLSRYQLELNTVYQAWAKTESDNLQVFQLDIQNELNQFNMENVKYQASVQESMAEFQSQNQMNIANAERSQNRQIQNSINDMKVLFDSNAQSIQKYSAELQQYQAEVAMEVQEYQQNLAGDLQVWQAERTTDLQKYGSDIQNALNTFNKDNVEYQAQLQQATQEVGLVLQKENQEYAAELQKYTAEVQNYQADVAKEVQEYQQNLAGDIQVWQAERQTDLQKYGTDVQNELNEFNKENVKYQAIVQEYIQEAQLLDAHEARKLQKYQAEIGTYSADVNTQVQEYQQNLQGDLQVWQTERQTDLQQYGSDLQNELNEFNKENAKYQAILQEYVQEAQLLDAHEARKIQKYQAESQTYQLDVNKQVQEYTQKLSRYQLEMSTSYQAWAKVESDSIAIYQADIQNELNEFNKENARYQANIQAEIAKFQVDAAEAQKEGDLTLQATIQDYTQELSLFSGEIQKYQAQVNKEVQEYTTQLQSDVQTMQGKIANNQALLTKYQAETADYQIEIAAEIQAYQQEIAEKTAEYQWQTARLQDLKQEYDQAFAIMAPAPQQQPQQQVAQRRR